MAAAPEHRARAVRAARLGGVVLLILLVLAAATLTWLLGTPSGRDWVWDRVAARVDLTAEQVEGTLAGKLRVHSLQLKVAGTKVEARHVMLDWRPGALLTGTLAFALEADGLGVALPPPGQEAPPAEEPSGFVLPLRLNARRVSIRDASVVLPDGTVQQVEQLNLAAAVDGQKVAIRRFQVTVPEGGLTVEGRAGTVPRAPLDLSVRWRLHLEEMEGPLTGEGRVTGRLNAPRFSQELGGVVVARIAGGLRWWDEPFIWEASARVESLNPAAVVQGWPDLPVAGSLQAEGTAEGLQAAADLHLQHDAVGPWQMQLEGIVEDGRWRIPGMTLAADGAGTIIRARGEGGLDLTDVSVAASWQNLRWPLRGSDPTVLSPSGQLQVAGRPEAYRIEATAGVEVSELPPSAWQLQATGDTGGLRITDADVRWMEGSWNASGNLAWERGLAWSMRGAARDVDPSAISPGWEGRIGGAVSSQGRWVEDRLQAVLEVEKVTGILRGYPFNAEGRAQYAEGKLLLEDVSISSGDSRVTAAGGVAQRWQLGWKLRSPRLAALYPELSGSASASGTVTGPREAPRLVLEARGSDVRFRTYGASRFSVDARVGLGEQPWSVEASAEGVRAETVDVPRLDVAASGTAADHQGTVSATLEGGHRLRLSAAGALKGVAWQGRLHGGQVRTATSGTWVQRAPAALAVDGGVTLAPFCLASGDSGLCLRGQGTSPADWAVRAEVNALPLALFEPWLRPAGWEVSGALDGSAEVARDRGIARLDVAFASDGGVVGSNLAEGERFSARYRLLSFFGRTSDEGLRGGGRLQLVEGGHLEAEFALPGWRPGQPLETDQPLRGNLALKMDQLGWISGFRPDVYIPSGTAEATMELGGTFAEPRLQGELALREGEVVLSRLGIRLQEVRLWVASAGDAVAAIRGRVRSGPGWIEMAGNITREPGESWGLQMRLTGSEFEAMRLPHARVLVSPELDLSLRAGFIGVTGTVRVPQATIRLREFPQTVEPSPDVVIVEQQSGDEPAPGWKTSLDVKVVFGDEVRVEGFGFAGRVVGDLSVRQRPGRPPVGQGVLRTVDARFEAYGQKLEVTEGRLMFAESPLSDPDIHFRAVRDAGEVLAGVEVTGDLRTPELRLFSEPPMEDANILAYLVLGRPLGTASQEEAGAVQQAALSLGLSGGLRIAREIGEEFGIEEVRLEREPGTDDASLVLGKYLSPRLYLQYAVGLWETVNTMRIRYRLGEKWTLEIESGLENAADLLYTIER